jgi:tetratricopeptide (TPR) repeat protein
MYQFPTRIRKKINALVFILFYLFVISTSTFASDENTLYVYFVEGVNSLQEYRGEVETILNAANKILKPYHYRLMLWNDVHTNLEEENEIQQTVMLSIMASDNDERTFSIGFGGYYPIHPTPIAKLLLEISPILKANYNEFILLHFHTDFDKNNANQVEMMAQLMAGLSLYHQAHCPEAIDILRRVQQLEDEVKLEVLNAEKLYSYTQFYIGTCLISEQKYDEAKEQLEIALPKIEAHDDFVYVEPVGYVINSAWLYQQTGDSQSSKNLLSQLLAISEFQPWKPELLKTLAQLNALAFDFQTALSNIDAALEIDPANAEFHTIRGEIHLLLYEWENARADFNQAVELDPLYADAYFQRGILHYTMIERSAAIVDFEQYLTLAPAGRYAEQAAKYIDSLKIEIEASGD